jgi:hypothetical protein
MLPLLSLLTTAVVSARTTFTCNETLGVTCEASRLTGLFGCGTCLGQNDMKLKSAGCTSADANAFCMNMTCVPSLFGQCRAAWATGELLQCSTCIGRNQHLLPTACNTPTEKAFCASSPCASSNPLSLKCGKHGNCQIDPSGRPFCNCTGGYSGKQCECTGFECTGCCSNYTQPVPCSACKPCSPCAGGSARGCDGGTSCNQSFPQPYGCCYSCDHCATCDKSC